MNKKINWDALGITASLACAIHCALLPLLFTSLPIFGINVIHNIAFETAMVVLAFMIGVYSLYHGYKKHHRSLVPLGVFSVGFLFLILKLFFARFEHLLLIPAVGCIVVAHIINYKSCQLQTHTRKQNSTP